MGDRTHVSLTVLKAQAEAAQELFDGYEPDEETCDAVETVFCFYEVNYGNLDFESALIEAGIAFDKRWETGSEYAAGTRYVRFDHHGVLQDIDLCDAAMNPDLDSLMALLDTPEELVQFIKDFHTKVTPLPWDNQIEYGRRYLALQLITA